MPYLVITATGSNCSTKAAMPPPKTPRHWKAATNINNRTHAFAIMGTGSISTVCQSKTIEARSEMFKPRLRTWIQHSCGSISAHMVKVVGEDVFPSFLHHIRIFSGCIVPNSLGKDRIILAQLGHFMFYLHRSSSEGSVTQESMSLIFLSIFQC